MYHYNDTELKIRSNHVAYIDQIIEMINAAENIFIRMIESTISIVATSTMRLQKVNKITTTTDLTAEEDTCQVSLVRIVGRADH